MSIDNVCKVQISSLIFFLTLSETNLSDNLFLNIEKESCVHAGVHALLQIGHSNSDFSIKYVEILCQSAVDRQKVHTTGNRRKCLFYTLAYLGYLYIDTYSIFVYFVKRANHNATKYTS